MNLVTTGIVKIKSYLKFNMENINKSFKITIPNVTDNALKLFVDNEYLGEVTTDQLSKIRVDIVEHINKTGDTSILDTFYLIGHKDSNTKMGEEIRITMDSDGNLSDSPWEINHVRRDILKLIRMNDKFNKRANNEV